MTDAEYYLDADEILWRFVEEDEGERILHSTEHDAMHPQWVVEEHYGPLVPLYREQTVECKWDRRAIRALAEACDERDRLRRLVSM